MSSNKGIEIERKYIIYKPNLSLLSRSEFFREYSIIQTYLQSPDKTTRRVRKIEYNGIIRYIETVKRRIDALSSYEDERLIEEEEYQELLSDRLKGSRDIVKTRYEFYYERQKYEIDVYGEWKNFCIMETELDSRDDIFELCPFINVYAEVTGRKEYSNMSMSLSFPEEPTE